MQLRWQKLGSSNGKASLSSGTDFDSMIHQKARVKTKMIFPIQSNIVILFEITELRTVS